MNPDPTPSPTPGPYYNIADRIAADAHWSTSPRRRYENRRRQRAQLERERGGAMRTTSSGIRRISQKSMHYGICGIWYSPAIRTTSSGICGISQKSMQYYT